MVLHCQSCFFRLIFEDCFTDSQMFFIYELSINGIVVDRFDFWKGHKNSYILTRTSPLSFMQMFFDRVLGVPDKTSLPMLEQIMKGDVL